MKQLLVISLGGALGAVLRYLCINLTVSITSHSFPYATLIVNVIGSALIGIAYVILIERMMLGEEWRLAIIVGLLGSFTTFSTFSLECFVLLGKGEVGAALAYIGVSVFLCLLATSCAVLIARTINL